MFDNILEKFIGLPLNFCTGLAFKVFTSTPDSIHQLRDRIVQAVDNLRQDQDLIRRAVRDMRRRCQLCIDRNGGHVEGSAP